MQALYDLLPVMVFFAAFKWFGMYVATIIGIIATALQVLASRYLKGHWVKQEVFTFVVFILFGGMTLYFHNPIFVKWKPTIIFGIFAVVILCSLFTSKPLLQRMMEGALESTAIIPKKVWLTISYVWAGFFLTIAGINLYIAYNCSNDAWVNFKFYGISGGLLILSIAQALYLIRYMDNNHHV